MLSQGNNNLWIIGPTITMDLPLLSYTFSAYSSYITMLFRAILLYIGVMCTCDARNSPLHVNILQSE